MDSKWYVLAWRRDVIARGLRVAAIVGTVLVAINQGDLILSGTLPGEAAWKIPLTYLVPYLVSTYASVAAMVSAAETKDSAQD